MSGYIKFNRRCKMKLINNNHTGRCVLINNIRDFRNDDFTNNNNNDCPFCKEMQEHEACCRYEELNDGEWVVRSIDNKYPALICDNEKFEKKEIDYGKHEVMIECADHYKNFYNFSLQEFKCIIKMYKERYIALSDEDNIKSVVIYKNHLRNAGASKVHSHSQILSMSFLPPEILKELEMLKKGIYANEENSIFENNNYIVFIPEDSFLAGEIIIKNKSNSKFESIQDDEIDDLCIIFKETFEKLAIIYGEIPFNIFLHSLPNDVNEDNFRWHIHVIPRKGQFGGFELGTGLYINSLDTENLVRKFKEL